jgi:putative endonuclease
MSSKHKARLPSGGLAEDGFSLTKTAMVYAYLIESVYQRQQHYVGITSDLKQRLIEHYEGKSPHTRKFKPWHLVTYTGFADEQTAQAFEKYLKSGSGKTFLKRHFLRWGGR